MFATVDMRGACSGRILVRLPAPHERDLQTKTAPFDYHSPNLTMCRKVFRTLFESVIFVYVQSVRHEITCIWLFGKWQGWHTPPLCII